MAAGEQSPSEVVMVRPKHFGFDAETAKSNAFQHASTKSAGEISSAALREFDAAVALFRSKGIKVKVFEDVDDGVERPDSIFPNNWFSCHDSGVVFVYPMLSECRRRERRRDVLEYLGDTRKVESVVDLSELERSGVFLEGTGSIVFDHVARVGYACVSPRTDEKTFRDVCQRLRYEAVAFRSVDEGGSAIYHTNVMMWVGTRAAGVCLESVVGEKDRANIREKLSSTGRAVVDLSFAEMGSLAGNCFELRNGTKRYLAISKRAEEGLREGTRAAVTAAFDELLVPDVGTIEHVGGGGIRCMVAGVHLPHK